MYKKILIPLENSPADQTILDHIGPLAIMCKSELILIHVADGFVARNQAWLNLQESEEIRVDREYLEKTASGLKDLGFPVKSVLRCGEPGAEILSCAAAEGCDLIAMATHGHGFIADTILGSVAEHVRHRTTIPMLMVRCPN